MTMQCQMLVMKQAVETMPFEKPNHIIHCHVLSFKAYTGPSGLLQRAVAAVWQLRNMPPFHTGNKALVLNTTHVHL